MSEPTGSVVQGAQRAPGDKNSNRKVAKGALWMVMARLADRSVGFVSTLILARLLVPADFGLVAMATAVIAMLELLKSFGFDIALIQRSSAERRHFDTVWTFNIIAGFGVALIMAVIAPAVASFYKDPRLVPILLVLAIGSVITGFENVGVVAFRKELQFQREFWYQFLRRLAGFALTIPLAFVIRGYWALVIGTAISRVFGVALSYYMHPYRPKFSLKASRDLLSFSGWILATNVVQFANTQSATFLIGKTAGPAPLGLFTLSYQIAALPTSELVAPVNRAVFPAYARQADDERALKGSYLRVMQFFAVLGFPGALGLAFCAPLLVPILLGDKWLNATPLVAILSFHAMLVAVGSNNHYLYLARGKPGWTTVLGTIYAAMLLPALIYSSLKWGALGAAWAYLLTQAVFTPVYYAMVRRVLDVTVRDFFAVFHRPAIAALAMWPVVATVMRLTNATHAPRLQQILALLATVAAGAVTYSSVLILVWTLESRPEGAERDIGLLIRQRWRSWTTALNRPKGA